MAVYRFKVYFEDEENVYREIEIKATQTFEDFHKVIQKAIGFDDTRPTAFYISNDTWRKGKEIRLLRNKQGDAQKNGWMHDVKIATHIEDPHQKMIYEFDSDGGDWTLLIELLKILPDSPVTYPRVNKSVGNPPPQYKITTPVEVPEDEEDAEESEEDNYVKSMPEQYVENEDEEVEHEIHAHAKPLANADSTEEDEDVVGEEGADGLEDTPGFEEEEI